MSARRKPDIIVKAPEEHFCQLCGASAAYGFGVFRNQPGKWFCRDHRHIGREASHV